MSVFCFHCNFVTYTTGVGNLYLAMETLAREQDFFVQSLTAQVAFGISHLKIYLKLEASFKNYRYRTFLDLKLVM